MSGGSSQGSCLLIQQGLFLGSGLIACYGRQRQEKCWLGTVNGCGTDVWERFVTTNDACCVVNDPSADFPKPGRVGEGNELHWLEKPLILPGKTDCKIHQARRLRW